MNLGAKMSGWVTTGREPLSSKPRGSSIRTPRTPRSNSRSSTISSAWVRRSTNYARRGPASSRCWRRQSRCGATAARLTLAEYAAAADVEPELIARTGAPAGFPDPEPDVPTFSHRDVEILAIMRAGIELLGEEVTIQMARVMGAAAARVADASVSAFVVNVIPQALEDDPSGLDLARANAESMVMIDGMTRGFDTFMRHHIERGFRPLEMVVGADGIDLVRRSIGFVDLVDSTAWTQQLELPALSQALNIFDSTASEIVIGRGGRVVKLIGDEIMFAANDALTAADIALALVEAFATHDVLPPVRAGIATGDVLARDGDFSGAVVNLAARGGEHRAPVVGARRSRDPQCDSRIRRRSRAALRAPSS